MGPCVMTALVIVAQAADPISGGAGWVGTGLLGAVLSWLLLVHLPAKDKQLKEIMDSKDALLVAEMNKRDEVIKDLTIAFNTQSRDMRKEFRETMDAVLASHERRVAELATAMRNELEQLHCRQQPRP
jgi:gas vesicle protein